MSRLARAIRSDPELARAIALADELLGRDDLGECGADMLDALGDLIEESESADVSPGSVIPAISWAVEGGPRTPPS